MAMSGKAHRHWLLVGVLLVSPLFLTGCALLRTLFPPAVVRVPADAPTIRQAIERVRPGGTVLVSPRIDGRPYREDLHIAKPLTLKGTLLRLDWEAVLIGGQVFITSTNVTLTGLTIRGSVDIQDSTDVMLLQVTIRSSPQDGLILRQGQAILQDSWIGQNSGDGVRVEQSELMMRNSRIDRNGGCGLQADDDSSISGEGNAVTDNAGGELCGPIPSEVGRDRLPPPAPLAVQVRPETWTNVNGFTIGLQEPWDPSGIAAAWYKLESPPNSPTDGRRAALQGSDFTVSASREGEQALYLWLEDGAGNADPSRPAQVRLRYDKTPPRGKLFIEGGEPVLNTNTFRVTLTLQVRDEGGSGLARMRFSNDGRLWSEWEEFQPTKMWDLSAFGGARRAGDHLVFAQVEDAAGNRIELNAFVLLIDRIPPPPPVNPEVRPSGWTNEGRFVVDWANPEDLSGIAASWYKLGAEPTAQDDGVRTTERPLIITEPPEGKLPLYLWLEDGQGNRDFTHYARVFLRYDKTPPTGGLHINEGASFTRCAGVRLAFWAEDQAGEQPGSGVVALRLSNNGQTWTDWEEFRTKIWRLIGYGDSSRSGRKTVWVQFRDAAGNLSEPVYETIYLDDDPLCRVPEDLPSIHWALEMARTGGTIQIAAGEYAEGTLWVYRDVTLQGVGPEKTILLGPREGGSVMVIGVDSDAQLKATLKDLALVGARFPSSCEGCLAEGLAIGSQASVALEGVRLAGNAGDGLWLGGEAQAVLNEVVIAENGDDGLDIGGTAVVEVYNSTIQGNGMASGCQKIDTICSGVEASDAAQVFLKAVTIVENADWGVTAHRRSCGFGEDRFSGAVILGEGVQIGENNLSGNHPEGQVCLP